MPVEKWSESVVVVHLAGEPHFSDDVDSLEQVVATDRVDSVVDFAAIRHVSSSNIARLLHLRRTVVNRDARLVLCNINTQVWGVFLITGLDKVFEFSDNVTTALATLQMKTS